ncbi:MAG: HigA family addiction module antitoxin [Myxococcota bacterium]|nr:HigA family addiction module antitoxin [Myxococcota bacterium]
MEARGWSQKDLAAILLKPEQAISEIINGNKSVTAETALSLSTALGTSAEFWINLQANFDLWKAEQNQDSRGSEAVARRARLYALGPIAELVKRGWIKKAESLPALEREVFGLLKIKSADQPPRLFANFRHSAARTPEGASRLTWLHQVDRVATKGRGRTFQIAAVNERLPELLALAGSGTTAQTALDWVRRQGIAVALVQHLPKTFIDGAAYHRDDGTPVLALTLRFDRIDYFWFTLLHELGHLLLNHQAQIDVQDQQGSPEESAANRFAQELLLPSGTLDPWRVAHPRMTRSDISSLAALTGRHPGIILGQLQHRCSLPFGLHRSLLSPVKQTLTEPLP